MSTFIGKKIEAATRPELETDDWALNIEICDLINENNDDAKDAIKAFRRRFQQAEQDRNFTVTNRTLTVLETCVSNCSRRFHVLVMSKDFIQDLVKLIGPKNNPPVDLQERVLRLIERWAEAFASQPDMSGVTIVYNDLKAKGITFPPQDPASNVPIQTPQRSVPAQSSPPPSSFETSGAIRLDRRQSSQQVSGPIFLEGEGYSKISQDLDIVRTSIEMFTEILQLLMSKNEDSDWQLAADLNTTCRQMKGRIVDLIEKVANEDLTIELLRLNDELNNIFIKYDRLLKDRSNPNTASQPSDRSRTTDSGQVLRSPGTTSAAPDNSSSQAGPSANELSLIDFGGDKQDHAAASKSAGARKDQDETESFRQDLEKLQLGENKKSVATELKKSDQLPDELSSLREQDFAEIENWLSSDTGRSMTSGGGPTSLEPISIANSEFENFIATRASANAGGKPDSVARPAPSNNPKPDPDPWQ